MFIFPIQEWEFNRLLRDVEFKPFCYAKERENLAFHIAGFVYNEQLLCSIFHFRFNKLFGLYVCSEQPS